MMKVGLEWIEGVKSNKKYSSLLLALFMTLALDTVMIFTMTSINIGWNELFFQRWLQGWIIGFAVAFPTSLATLPIARKITTQLVAKQPQNKPE